MRLIQRRSPGLAALWRLTWTSVLLGATFLGIGYALSSSARRASGAAGLAIGLWLGLVVLYDLGLLAAVVADDGGVFTTDVFPLALLANPADAFRLFNLAAPTPRPRPPASAARRRPSRNGNRWLSILVWPLAPLALATLAFRKVEP